MVAEKGKMPPRVAVHPDLLRWALDRAGLDEEAAVVRFKGLDEWLAGRRQPTFRQLEEFASGTYTAFGYFFLDRPPVESLPIPDLRTVGGKGAHRPSGNMLDMIYLCQRRQEWFRDYQIEHEVGRVEFVGSVTTNDDVVKTAETIRKTLGFDVELRAGFADMEAARKSFVAQAEAAGVLVLTSGTVGCNTSRVLSVEEFRGFALSDDYAPLVFINGRDAKSAQMFTLAHELAHIWLGASAVSNARLDATIDGDVERWCNAVAAEMLVPRALLPSVLPPGVEVLAEARRLARKFKVSALVILRRLGDLRIAEGGLVAKAFAMEMALVYKRDEDEDSGGGGNFHANLRQQVGQRFARAIVTDTLAGRTLHREAASLLGFSKVSTIDRFAESLG